MFTGIVEEVGTVSEAAEPKPHSGRLLGVRCSFASDTQVGDSIAINGVCQTLVEVLPKESMVRVFASDVTLQQTTLRHLRPNQNINLERALKASDRLGGHFVYGHIDARSSLRRVVREGGHHIAEVALQPSERMFVVRKGSIAIDGVAFTINRLTEDGFEVVVVPHTYASTTFASLREGSEVNLEFDMLGKFALNVSGSQRKPRPRP